MNFQANATPIDIDGLKELNERKFGGLRRQKK